MKPCRWLWSIWNNLRKVTLHNSATEFIEFLIFFQNFVYELCGYFLLYINRLLQPDTLIPDLFNLQTFLNNNPRVRLTETFISHLGEVSKT
jgi:hypothetical protein